MLNISYHQITGQQLNCPIGQPPYVPQLPKFAHMQQITPTLASYIVNFLSSNLSSAGRVYVFNKAAYNNWVSEGLADLTELGCMILEIGRQRGIQISDQAIQQAADQAIAMYVSREIVQNDQLRVASSPESINAAYQNVQQLNSYVQQLNVSNVQGGGMGGGMGYPPQGGQGMYPPHIHNRHAPHPPRTNQNLQSGISRGHTTLGTNSQSTQPSPVDQSRHFTRQSRQERQREQMPVAEVITPRVVTKDDWKPSAAQYHRSLINKTFEQEVYTTDVSGNVIQLVEELQENYMDREKHRLVTVLGDSFHLNTNVREQRIGASVDQLSLVKQIDLRAATEDSPEAEETRKSIIKHVYPNLISDVFLESAMFSGRMHQLENQSISAVEAYRCFAIIFKPQFTKDNCNPILNSLSKYKTFSSLADAMRDTGSRMQERFINTQDDAVRFDNQDAVLYINSLDVMLTEFINSFLKNNLSLAKLRIGSFVEDVGGFSDYLDETFSPRYSAAFKAFEFFIMDSLLPAPTEETEKGLLDILTNADGELPCNFGFIPVSYSFTYLNVLSKELALDGLMNEALLIREKESPVLFDVAQSLFKQSEAFPVAPMYNLLITQDQRVFKIYKGFLSTNSYLIGQ
jgi:hypothetical protein